MMRRNLTIAALGLALAMGGLALSPAADAAKLKAKVYLTQRKVPNVKSERQLLSFARKNFTLRLRETKEKKLNDRKWKGDMIVSFNHGVGDTEFQVLWYDVHDGPRRFVEDMAVFVSKRDEKTFVSGFSLGRPEFKPNRQHELVVTVRRAEVGRQKFTTQGEQKKRSGFVGFTDDER
jgi:hypothetical protein